MKNKLYFRFFGDLKIFKSRAVKSGGYSVSGERDNGFKFKFSAETLELLGSCLRNCMCHVGYDVISFEQEGCAQRSVIFLNGKLVTFYIKKNDKHFKVQGTIYGKFEKLYKQKFETFELAEQKLKDYIKE